MEAIEQKLEDSLERQQRLLDTEEKNLANAQGAIERLKWQIAFIRDLLVEQNIATATPPVQNSITPKVGNQHYRLMLSVGNTPGWVREILETSGRAMRVKDIVEAICVSGMAGKDLGNNEDELKRLADNVSSTLNRKVENSPFIKVGRGIFDLKSRVQK